MSLHGWRTRSLLYICLGSTFIHLPLYCIGPQLFCCCSNTTTAFMEKSCRMHYVSSKSRLQSVGLMRTEMNDESEKLMSKCGTINEIRKIAEENPILKEDLITSLQAPIHLLRDVFNHQSLKDEPFETFTAATGNSGSPTLQRCLSSKKIKFVILLNLTANSFS